MKEYKKLTTKMLEEAWEQIVFPSQPPFLNEAMNQAVEKELLKMINNEELKIR